MWRSVAVAFGWILAAGVARAAEPVVVREGDWWVGTVTGSTAVPPMGSIRITGRVNLMVSGAAGDRASWELRTRIKAPDAAAARERIGTPRIRTFVRGGEAHFVLEPGSGEGTAQLAVPHTLRRVSIALGDGGVQAYGLDGAISVVTGGGEIKADRIRGDFIARSGGGNIYLGEIGGSARCSTAGGTVNARVVHGEAYLETGAGDIAVVETGGALRVSTGGGTVRIARAGAGVIATSGGGRVDVGQAHGLVEVRNSGGPVWVGAANGVRCEAVAGGIRLSNVSGSLRASTAIGSIVAQLLGGEELGDSFLTTGRGDITVFIPSNVGVKIRAENEMPGGTRRIISDYPGILTRVVGSQVVAEGEINGGGPLLRISGTGGTIFIKRK